ncbi:MAG: SPOR domain-containing protein [Niveispirillum sp.]|uniref:SPOR domain-containing protein n=1 Tax=Niveispirillum sp. TaxID=1917217 RepID=UPI0006B9A600
MTRGRLILILSGILLFGLLTFGIGLLVGLNMQAPTVPPAAQTPGPKASSAAATPDAAPAPTPDTAAVPAKGTIVDPPPIIPIGPPPPMVTDVTSAADPKQPVSSPLMGPLAAQAATPPPPPPPPQPAVPAPPPSTRILAVQLGRFTRQDSATVFAKRLAEKGYKPQIVMADYAGMPPWYLVTLAPQPDEATAKRVAGEMSALLGIEVIVISWAAPPAK